MNLPNITERTTVFLAAFALVASTHATQILTHSFTAEIPTDINGNDQNGGGIDFGYCGDGRINWDSGEECDSGEKNGEDDYCTYDCYLESNNNGYCGDGILGNDEECDDGSENGSKESSCSTCCIRKPEGEEQEEDCDCGNGTIEWPEQCDKGYRNGFDITCNKFCREKGSSTGTGGDDGGNRREECGNGIQEGTEECDDGNGDNTDDCTNKCYKAICGDEYVQPNNNESCDEGGKNGTADSKCTIDCKTVIECGDGKVEGSEECDDGNGDDSDECTSKCKKAYCGDGYTQKSANEECDKGDDNGKDNSDCSSVCKKIEDDTNASQASSLSINTTTRSSSARSSINSNQSVTSSNGNEDQNTNTSSGTRPAAPDEDERKRLEELQNKREEMQKRIEESMRKAREEANRLRDEAQARQDSAEEQRKDLLCFDSTGELTDDREQCAEDQSQFLRPEELDDEEARERIRKKLLGEDIAEKHRAELLATMQDSRLRLQNLLSNNGHRDEVVRYLNQSIEWLDRGITYFSGGPKNIQEIQQMVAPVKQLLSQATSLIQEDKDLSPERVEIDPIVMRTEILLRKFRESFIALAQGGVELDQEALSSYVDAAGLYVEIRNACVEDQTQCGRLNNVLEKLKEVQEFLQQAFGENPEIYEAVQAKFDQD